MKIIYIHLSRKDRLLIIPESYLDFLDRKKFGMSQFEVVNMIIDLWHTICFLYGHDYQNIAVEVDMPLNRIY